MAPRMSRVEASGIVDADSVDLFHFTDWCYNAHEWFPSIRKAWIIKLPDSAGLGKVARYVGNWMGREIEWEAESVEWKENELRIMRPISGLPARMNMQMEWRYDAAGPCKTRVTCVFEYRVPYSFIGWLIDLLFIRPEAQRQVNDAVEGMKKAADQQRVPPVDLQIERVRDGVYRVSPKESLKDGEYCFLHLGENSKLFDFGVDK